MENITDKYSRLRSSINNGDILLIRGNSFLAKSIQFGDDNAYFNHALVVFKIGDRLLCIQAMAQGVIPAFLSTEILANADFTILRPQVSQDIIDNAVNSVFDKAESGIKYNKLLLVKILAQRKLGININMKYDDLKTICSVFAGITYGGYVGLSCYKAIFVKQGYFLTPQDIIRYLDPSQIKVVA